MRLSSDGLRLIKAHEGLRLSAYKCPAGVWTIGYGHTRTAREGMTINTQQADALLLRDVRTFEQGVAVALTKPATQAQFDALVSFAFNVGLAGLRRSSVLRAHNAGDYQAASRAFSLWNKAGGRELPGLTRRRAEEAALYLSDLPTEGKRAEPIPSPDMPQSVDPERPLRDSEINRAAVGAGAMGTVAIVGESARTVGEVRTSLGDWLLPGLLVAVVALCAYIVWQRRKQRKGGWA
jgi:lysozyme